MTARLQYVILYSKMKNKVTNKQLSVRLFARVPSAIHREAKMAAIRDGIFLEEWAARAIEEKLDREKNSNLKMFRGSK